MEIFEVNSSQGGLETIEDGGRRGEVDKSKKRLHLQPLWVCKRQPFTAKQLGVSFAEKEL